MSTRPVDPTLTLADLRQLVAEEMHLLGLELEDAIDGSQIDRLEQLTQVLNEACDLLSRHRPPTAG